MTQYLHIHPKYEFLFDRFIDRHGLPWTIVLNSDLADNWILAKTEELPKK